MRKIKAAKSLAAISLFLDRSCARRLRLIRTAKQTPTIKSINGIPMAQHRIIASDFLQYNNGNVLLDLSLTVKAAPHACVIRTGQP